MSSAREPDASGVVPEARAVALEVLDDLEPKLIAGSGAGNADMKRDGTPITAADVEVDRALTEAIDQVFPDHEVMSEELQTVAPESEWTWVLDPIDGTSNYAAGIPWWCVSVALLRDGVPEWALVDAPAVGQRFEATRGGGATVNGYPLEVVPEVDFSDPENRHVPVLVSAGVLRRANRGVHLNPRILGAVALDLCQVAAGTAAASFTMQPHVWDVAAGSLVLTEAGSALVRLDGPELLPLVPGTDYRSRTALTGAGPSEEYVRRLAEAVFPKE